MYYIFSFRSRNQSMRFFDTLKSDGITSKIINTPRSVSVGCGLSVAVESSSVSAAKRILSLGVYDTFIGLFRIYNNTAERIS